MLYNIHQILGEPYIDHLVAVVLGKTQAECLADQLSAQNPGCTFVASIRPDTEPLTHWVDSSFAD
jgi:hypothetical protein